VKLGCKEHTRCWFRSQQCDYSNATVCCWFLSFYTIVTQASINNTVACGIQIQKSLQSHSDTALVME